MRQQHLQRVNLFLKKYFLLKKVKALKNQREFLLVEYFSLEKKIKSGEFTTIDSLVKEEELKEIIDFKPKKWFVGFQFPYHLILSQIVDQAHHLAISQSMMRHNSSDQKHGFINTFKYVRASQIHNGQQKMIRSMQCNKCR